jgi:putative flippase GtrA
MVLKKFDLGVFLKSELRQQFTRFLQVGVLNTVCTYLLYLALIPVVPYVIAYLISFVVGVLISAWLNARYSFTSHLTVGTLVRFTIIYMVSFALSVQLLMFFVEIMEINPKIAPLIVLAVFTPLNFLASRFALTSFRKRQG